MITDGAKLWFAVTFYALVAAAAYFLATAGEHGGAVTLLFIAAGAAVIGGASIAVRDGDSEVGEKEAVAIRSALPAPWPALGALGAGVTIVGWSTGGVLLYIGFGILGITLIEWMVQGWAERSTADPAYNKALRDRIMFPIEVPTAGLLGLGLVILTFSRVLLALPNKDASTIVAICVATLITATAFLVASRPRISANVLSWILAIAAVALLAGGVIGGAVGERDIEPHHAEEHAEESEQ